jgi:DNA uptake protein ComE-like DNA-binding protein
LLILSLVVRVGVAFFPNPQPPEAEQFFQEARLTLLTGELRESKEEEGDIPGQPSRQIQPVGPGRPETGAWQIQEINLNAADSASLLPLPGIGPVLAGRIIKYRRLLGGFVNLEQVLEVYGISPTTFGLIQSRIYVDSTAFYSMEINTLDFGALLRHPYLEIDDVRRIVNFREFSGNIISVEELSFHNLLPDSTLEKLLPYLDFRH